MNPLQAPIPPLGSEVVERGPPWGQIVGKHPPSAPGAQHIADSVDYLPSGVLDWPASRLGRWQQRFQQLPPPGRLGGCDVMYAS